MISQQSMDQARTQRVSVYFNRILETERDLLFKRRHRTVAFAKLALGQRISIEDLKPVLNRIYYRKDCTDFDINVLLRMVRLYPGQLADDLRRMLKEVFLDYDYWFHENNKRPGSKIIWTENHVLQYLSAEYLAAIFYPGESFRMRGMKGSEIRELQSEKLKDYILIKARTGFCEWDSNVYADENFHALMNIHDFTEDDELKEMSRNLLDIMMLQMACQSYKGHYGTSHGRAYDRHVLSARNDNTMALQYLAWGVPDLSHKTIGAIGAVSGLAFASGSYTPPAFIIEAALDSNPVETKTQQSFNVEDGPTLGKGYEKEEDLVLYWHNMAYTHRNILKQNIAMEKKYHLEINEWTYLEYLHMRECEERGEEAPLCRCPNYMGRVNTCCWKTADYMLSCAQNFRKGERGYQQHIWQASMDGGINIFTSHPGIGPRPGYWAGNDIMPAAVQYRNTLICIYELSGNEFHDFTHAHFPVKEFDRTAEKDRWIFGMKNNGYVGLYSQNGFTRAEDHGGEDFELRCGSRENTWICRMGRTEDDGSFEEFIEQTLGSTPCFQGGTVSLQAGDDRISFSSDSELRVNGRIEKITDYPRIDNRYISSRYMSDVYTIKADLQGPDYPAQISFA